MDVYTIDFETFWSTDYSVSKMSPLEYVLGDRYETISCSIKRNDEPTEVFFGDEVEDALSRIDWPQVAACGHNMSGFDAYILAYRYKAHPKLWLCTAAMARPIHAKTTGASLAALVKHYGLGVKDNAVLLQTKGRHLADFTPGEIDAMRVYNKADTDQCRALFKILSKHYNSAELWQIDALTRMRTEPAFVVDVNLLEHAACYERDRKRLALREAATLLGLESEVNMEEEVRSQLASAPKFAALLTQLGVEVPMKPSPTNPDKEVPALAKTDEAFLALQEHDNPVVAAAARTRLDVKSTLLETRIQKFLTAARLTGGRLPVPLKYCGADTTGRDSGEEYNCFTGDVEVLTPSGWVRFDEWVREPAPIMQWWSDNRLTFEASPGVLVKSYAGPIIDIESRCASYAVTPDHRLVALPDRRSGGALERTAGWVADHSGLDRVPASGVWEGADGGLRPEAVRLAVALSADGCVTGEHIQVGLRRPRKIARMRELLDAAGAEYHVRTSPPQAGHTGGHDTVTYVVTRSALGKGFGAWILTLSREALDAFVDELRYWDGQSHSKTGNLCFWTSKPEEAGWVQTALALSGVVSTVRVYPRQEPHAPKVLVYARSAKYTSISTASDVERRHYDGQVYCASVESSYILVRRNSKVSVVGQCQNLPRITPGERKASDALRNSLRAPHGYKVIVADQSGIELRVNHFLWQVPSSMALYRESPDKADLYKDFASRLYDADVDEVTKPQRQIGKVAHLGLGFGAGPAAFKRVAKTMGGIDLADHEAMSITYAWREEYAQIVDGWRTCHAALPLIEAGIEQAVDPWGLVRTCAEGFRLPSGRLIRYPDLRQEIAEGEGNKKEWVYAHGRHKARIYAGKVTENLVQALARDSIFDCALEFFRQTGLRPALRVHDELVYVVPAADAERQLATLQDILRTPPKWWPELVVWSEGDVADTYGSAK